MARIVGRLTVLDAEKATQAGMYADGAGLYLRVTKEGTKSWVFRFMLNGPPRWMGLGPFASSASTRPAAKRWTPAGCITSGSTPSTRDAPLASRSGSKRQER